MKNFKNSRCLWKLILFLHSAFCILPCFGQTVPCYFTNLLFTGVTNDTTMTITPVNNPVIFNGITYWYPGNGFNITSSNSVANTNLVPGAYTISFTNVPRSWTLYVPNNGGSAINAAQYSTNLTVYSGIQGLYGSNGIVIIPTLGGFLIVSNSSSGGGGGFNNVVNTNDTKFTFSGTTLLGPTNFDIGGVAATIGAQGSNFTYTTSNTLSIAELNLAQANSNFTYSTSNTLGGLPATFAQANSNFTYTTSNTLSVAALALAQANSNFTYTTSNTLSIAQVAGTNNSLLLSSNYAGQIGAQGSNFTYTTSNTLSTAALSLAQANSNLTYSVSNILSTAALALAQANSNFTYTTSNTLSIAQIAGTNNALTLSSNYAGQIGAQGSNFTYTTSNTLSVGALNLAQANSNFTYTTSNTLSAAALTLAQANSNFTYTTSNTLSIAQIAGTNNALTLSSNYTAQIGAQGSNFTYTTSNTLSAGALNLAQANSNFTYTTSNTLSVGAAGKVPIYSGGSTNQGLTNAYDTDAFGQGYQWVHYVPTNAAHAGNLQISNASTHIIAVELTNNLILGNASSMTNASGSPLAFQSDTNLIVSGLNAAITNGSNSLQAAKVNVFSGVSSNQNLWAQTADTITFTNTATPTKQNPQFQEQTGGATLQLSFGFAGIPFAWTSNGNFSTVTLSVGGWMTDYSSSNGTMQWSTNVIAGDFTSQVIGTNVLYITGATNAGMAFLQQGGYLYIPALNLFSNGNSLATISNSALGGVVKTNGFSLYASSANSLTGNYNGTGAGGTIRVGFGDTHDFGNESISNFPTAQLTGTAPINISGTANAALSLASGANLTNTIAWSISGGYGTSMSFNGAVAGLGTNLNLGIFPLSDFGFSVTNTASGNQTAYDNCVAACTNAGGGLIWYGSRTNNNGSSQIINLAGEHFMYSPGGRIILRGDRSTIINFTGTNTTHAVFWGLFDPEDVVLQSSLTLNQITNYYAYPYTNMVGMYFCGYSDTSPHNCSVSGFGQDYAFEQLGSVRGPLITGCLANNADIGFAIGDQSDHIDFEQCAGRNCVFAGLDAACVVPIPTNSPSAFINTIAYGGTNPVAASQGIVNGGMWNYDENTFVIGKGSWTISAISGNVPPACTNSIHFQLGHPGGLPIAYPNQGCTLTISAFQSVNEDSGLVLSNIVVNASSSSLIIKNHTAIGQNGGFGIVTPGGIQYCYWSPDTTWSTGTNLLNPNFVNAVSDATYEYINDLRKQTHIVIAENNGAEFAGEAPWQIDFHDIGNGINGINVWNAGVEFGDGTDIARLKFQDNARTNVTLIGTSVSFQTDTGVGSKGTGTAISMGSTGITNTTLLVYRLCGLTGTSVTQTNATDGSGFSRGTITTPIDITLQPNEYLRGSSMAAQNVKAW